jgi:hypothetical protein
MIGVVVHGWDISEDDGLFSAVRQGDLTEYQVMYGALSLLDARDEGELWMLCDAQTRLAERLMTAEITARTAQIRRATAALS